jgi:hypothetical protein
MGLRVAAELAREAEGPGVVLSVNDEEDEDIVGLPPSWRHNMTPEGVKLWRQASMPLDAWSALPLPVLDVIFRKGLSFFDLRNVGMTCKRWHSAVHRKIPYTKKVFADNERAWERRRERRRQEERAQRRKDLIAALLKLLLVMIASIPICLFLAAGVTGLLYFPGLIRAVSTVPDCPQMYSMTVALYCCCAFWVVDAVLFAMFLLAVHVPGQCGCCTWCYGISDRRKFRLFNGIGLLSNMGMWSSAAACIHFANACMGANAAVAWPVRAYAATSVTFGLLLNILGTFVQCITSKS